MKKKNIKNIPNWIYKFPSFPEIYGHMASSVSNVDESWTGHKRPVMWPQPWDHQDTRSHILLSSDPNDLIHSYHVENPPVDAFQNNLHLIID